MKDAPWLAVLSRISAAKPLDLDAAVFEQKTGAAGAAKNIKAAGRASAVRPPSVKLWDAEQSGNSYLGVRVDELLSDCTHAAVRLAAAALERGIIPIILTTLPDSGFERFGFRVERIMGATASERAVCEEELKRFWNMAIVIDISDVASLN